MQSPALRSIATEFLVPFFSGAFIEDGRRASTQEDPLVEQIDENTIVFKISTLDKYRLALRRRQQFSKDIDVIPETSVVRAFVETLADMGEAIDGAFQRDLLTTFQRRVVARSVAASRGDEDIILRAIDRLANLSNRLLRANKFLPH